MLLRLYPQIPCSSGSSDDNYPDDVVVNSVEIPSYGELVGLEDWKNKIKALEIRGN
jgi:hypothetical protein